MFMKYVCLKTKSENGFKQINILKSEHTCGKRCIQKMLGSINVAYKKLFNAISHQYCATSTTRGTNEGKRNENLTTETKCRRSTLKLNTMKCV